MNNIKTLRMCLLYISGIPNIQSVGGFLIQNASRFITLLSRGTVLKVDKLVHAVSALLEKFMSSTSGFFNEDMYIHKQMINQGMVYQKWRGYLINILFSDKGFLIIVIIGQMPF